MVRNQFASAGKCERCERLGFNPWVRKIPWSRKWQPTPVFLPGESYGQRSLVGYSPWGRKELDMTVSVCVHPHVPAPARTRTRTRTHAQAHTHTLQVKVYRKIHCVNQSRELEQLHQFQTRRASEHGRSSGIKGAMHDDEGSAFLRDLTVLSVCEPNSRASRYTD